MPEHSEEVPGVLASSLTLLQPLLNILVVSYIEDRFSPPFFPAKDESNDDHKEFRDRDDELRVP